MKRNYKYMIDQKGFIFPFTLITITIIFLVLMTLINRFEKEVAMTHNLQNQFVIESLFSLALSEKETTIRKDAIFPPSEVYHYPQGQVTISYTPFDTFLRSQFLISTNNQKQYVLYQSDPWDESIENDEIK